MKTLLVKYILKPLKYIQNFIYRIITYPLHLGASDYYPPVHYLPQNNPLSRTISFPVETRIKYWTKIAKTYPAFKPFYDKNDISRYLESINIDNKYKYYKEINEFYQNGYTFIEDFLDEHEHNQIKEIFKEKLDDKICGKSIMAQHVIKDNYINMMLHKSIASLEKTIFGREIKQQRYILQALSICDNTSPYKTSVNWHQDRFIPSFKMFYFPTAVETNPLEFYKGSHFIDQQFLKNSLVSATKDRECRDSYYDYTGYSKESFYVKENTLIIGATHGLHRRLHENKNGVRKFITFNYYKTFTRYDLYKNYLIQAFKKRQ